MKVIRNISLEYELAVKVKEAGLNLSQLCNNYIESYFGDNEETKTN